MTFDVQVISVSWSQNATLSPNQRGTSAPSRGTAPLMSKVRPTLKCRMKFSALLAMSCTRSGVVDEIHREVRLAREHAHEAVRPAELRRPQRRVVDGLVVVHLHRAPAVLRRQQREDRRGLVDRREEPLRRFGQVRRRCVRLARALGHELQGDRAAVSPVPVGRRIFARVDRRPAMRRGFREQRLVVLLRALVNGYGETIAARG